MTNKSSYTPDTKTKTETFLKDSDKNYLKGLIKNFIFTLLTLLIFAITNWIVSLLNINSANIYGRIINSTINIGSVLAIVQLGLFILYSLVSWIKECWKEIWKK
jgi:amino acid transporter